jgi:hypothetical protein
MVFFFFSSPLRAYCFFKVLGCCILFFRRMYYNIFWLKDGVASFFFLKVSNLRDSKERKKEATKNRFWFFSGIFLKTRKLQGCRFKRCTNVSETAWLP